MEKELSRNPLYNRSDEMSLLRFLRPSQIAMIDEALSAVGDFGEVRLIVEKGHLRFIVTERSFDALKWQPGSLYREAKLPHQS